jgi:hypothetical protein
MNKNGNKTRKKKKRKNSLWFRFVRESSNKNKQYLLHEQQTVLFYTPSSSNVLKNREIVKNCSLVISLLGKRIQDISVSELKRAFYVCL